MWKRWRRINGWRISWHMRRRRGRRRRRRKVDGRHKWTRRSRNKRSMGRSLKVASVDACSGKWDDGDHPSEPWVGGESWRGVALRTSSLEDDMGRSLSRKLWMSIKKPTKWCINRLMSQGSLYHMSNIYGSSLMSLTCVSCTPSILNRWHMWSTKSV